MPTKVMSKNPAVTDQQADRIRTDFDRTHAEPLAHAAAPGHPLRRFEAKVKLSGYASWFSDDADSVLIAVMAEHQPPQGVDDVLGFALAWQHDRSLLLLVPRAQEQVLTNRLARVGTEVHLFTYDQDRQVSLVTLPTVADVVQRYRCLTAPAPTVHHVTNRHRGWIAKLLNHESLRGTTETKQKSYLALKYAGNNLLTLTSRPNSDELVLTVGIGSKPRPTGVPVPFTLTIHGLLTDGQLADVLTVIEHDQSQRSWEKDNGEHRLQAALVATGPAVIGLLELRREMPCVRQQGRGGAIDFIGLDEDGHLHVVETKIGPDVSIIAQVLDYVNWVQAHETHIRSHHGWPQQPEGARVHVDFVLASKASGAAAGKAVGPYFASQLEALSEDLPVKVWVVEDAEAAILTTHPLDEAQLRQPGRHVREPLLPPRQNRQP